MQQELLTTIFTEYQAYLQEEKGLAEKSRQGYLRAARRFLNQCQAMPKALYLPADWGLDDLDKRALEIYLEHLRRERKWKERSLSQHASAIKSFFAYLHRRGLIARNPVRNLQPQYRRHTPDTPEGEQEAVRKLFGGRAGGLSPSRTRMVMELIYGAGFRPSKAYRVQGLEPLPGADEDEAPNLRVLLAEGPHEVRLTAAGLGRVEQYLAQRARVAGPADPFWVNANGSPRGEQLLARDIKAAMEQVGLEGKPSLLWQLAARHFMERGGDLRSARTLLGARHLGAMERYARKDPREWLRKLREIHPRGGSE